MFSLLLDGNFTCQNGELQRDSTNNALYICIYGDWRTLCYNEYLWGPTQATVACRELNPGKTVVSKHISSMLCDTGVVQDQCSR